MCSRCSLLFMARSFHCIKQVYKSIPLQTDFVGAASTKFRSKKTKNCCGLHDALLGEPLAWSKLEAFPADDSRSASCLPFTPTPLSYPTTTTTTTTTSTSMAWESSFVLVFKFASELPSYYSCYRAITMTMAAAHWSVNCLWSVGAFLAKSSQPLKTDGHREFFRKIRVVFGEEEKYKIFIDQTCHSFDPRVLGSTTKEETWLCPLFFDSNSISNSSSSSSISSSAVVVVVVGTFLFD